MIKKIIKILFIFLILSLIIAGILFYGIYYSAEHVVIKNETIYDKSIPASLNNKKIAFISDIKYNEFMTESRLNKMIGALTSSDPDIVIFGGDIFSTTENRKIDSKMVNELTDILKKIKAPLGKFAIYGDADLKDDQTKEIVDKILFDSNFEILSNDKIKLRNESMSSITLIGLDPLINGNLNFKNTFDNVSDEEFVIMATHCPDLITNSEINTKYTNIILSGHSLGGQIRLPIIGPLTKIKGATNYSHGDYIINNTHLFVSNGLGTTNYDMRLFARPEILILHLQHSDK